MRRCYWCDAIDPRTAYALHGPPGQQYNEVLGAEVLLGYVRQQLPGSNCPMISHPTAGTHVYPATLFTTAPLPILRAALTAGLATPSNILQVTGDRETALGMQAAAAAAAPLRAALTSVAAVKSNAISFGNTQSSSSSSSIGSSTHHLQQQQEANSGGAPVSLPHNLLTAGSSSLACALNIRGLTLTTPSKVPVVTDLTLQVRVHGSLLITGPSGAGKSTLVRCLAGLWGADSGAISLPPRRVMFLTQRPITAPGPTLREQILYPDALCSCDSCNSAADGAISSHTGKYCNTKLATVSCVRDSSCSNRGKTPEAFAAIVRKVGLGYLLDTLNVDVGTYCDWGAILSPGELQRLAIARVLYHKPTLAVLDESTSSLGIDAEQQLYSLLMQAGIAYVSVGHRESLRAVHHCVLHIHGDGLGTWGLAGLQHS